MNKAELTRGGGWVGWAQRLLDDGQQDCVERGYLLYAVALGCISRGRLCDCKHHLRQATEIGDRFHDLDLVTLARVGHWGPSLVRAR